MNNLKNYNQFNESINEDPRLIELYNTYITFTDVLNIIFKEFDEIPDDFTKDMIQNMNDINKKNITQIRDILDIEKDIKKNAEELLRATDIAISKDIIQEDDYFKVGTINKLKSLLRKDILGFKN